MMSAAYSVPQRPAALRVRGLAPCERSEVRDRWDERHPIAGLPGHHRNFHRLDSSQRTAGAGCCFVLKRGVAKHVRCADIRYGNIVVGNHGVFLPSLMLYRLPGLSTLPRSRASEIAYQIWCQKSPNRHKATITRIYHKVNTLGCWRFASLVIPRRGLDSIRFWPWSRDSSPSRE